MSYVIRWTWVKTRRRMTVGAWNELYDIQIRYNKSEGKHTSPASFSHIHDVEASCYVHWTPDCHLQNQAYFYFWVTHAQYVPYPFVLSSAHWKIATKLQLRWFVEGIIFFTVADKTWYYESHNPLLQTFDNVSHCFFVFFLYINKAKKQTPTHILNLMHILSYVPLPSLREPHTSYFSETAKQRQRL